MNSVDRFSIMFMGIGFFGTIFVAGLIGLIVHVLYSFAIIALFVLVLGCVLLNNNKKLNYTRQSLILNMAILIYLENQNNLLSRGCRAQMGHMGNWIEFKKEKIHGKSKTMKSRPMSSNATFKRELQGLQTAGLYLNTPNVGLTQQNRRADFFSLKASQARLDRSRQGLRPSTQSQMFRSSHNSRPGSGYILQHSPPKAIRTPNKRFRDKSKHALIQDPNQIEDQIEDLEVREDLSD